MANRTRAGRPVERTELEEIVVEKGINRCNTVRKGGRLFGYSAIVVVGNRKGTVGYGFGKAREVPAALEKAGKRARKNLYTIPVKGDTIPHTVWGRFGAAKVLLKPAGGGTGIVAGGAVRAVVELAGVKEEDIEIVVSRNEFVIRGERKAAPPAGSPSYLQGEIASGPFERHIALPRAVEPRETKASYEDGMVHITLPKVKEERVRIVQVRVV